MPADLLSPVKRLAKRALRHPKVAQHLVAHALSTPAALARIAARGLEVRTVIDVGASDGRWSLQAEDVWAGARYHLVEANRVHEDRLRRLCARKPEYSYSLLAAGPTDGTVPFDDGKPFGGRAAPDDGAPHAVVPQRSLSSLVAELGLAPPFLIKLDTHGYEAPILDGAASLLRDTNLFVIEAYNFPLPPDGLRFHQLCGLMAERGFNVIDVSEPLWRSKDGALWQFDLFFIPSTRPEFAYTRFR
ncbi:MAG TPA: FkbM family methyltransferase [Geminicoccaceae bacterium]|nr:FkbM family methyltransferase [Geminicoccaceae bacterium]